MTPWIDRKQLIGDAKKVCIGKWFLFEKLCQANQWSG